jgi:transcriptional regulator of heat shock response
MNERQKNILTAVVELYTSTALPVGSQALLDHYDFGVSSATLRSDMVYLEELGLLRQPHTSAGRVPTDLGYRTYVEEVMGEELLTKAEQTKLQTELLIHKAKQARTARTTAKLLSLLSGNLAVAGIADRDQYYDFGMRELLEDPEFQELDEMARLVETLDTLDDRLEAMTKDLLLGETRIYIGEENPIPEIHNCSMMVTPFQTSDGRGVLAIIGPKRMHYARNKSLLEYVERILSNNSRLLSGFALTFFIIS